MGNVKIGDKVRVVALGYVHRFDVGSIVTVTGVYPDGIRATDGIVKWDLNPDEYESIAPTPIVVGGEYTSENGNKWKCIFVDGDFAWLAPEGLRSAAYVFKTDGTNISQGGGDYNIKFEPVREPIEVYGSFNRGFYDYEPNYITHHLQMGDHKFTMTIDMVDGKPDWSTAKVTGA